MTSGVKVATPGKLPLAGGRAVNLLALPPPAGKRGGGVAAAFPVITKDARERGTAGSQRRVRLCVRPRGAVRHDGLGRALVQDGVCAITSPEYAAVRQQNAAVQWTPPDLSLLGRVLTKLRQLD